MSEPFVWVIPAHKTAPEKENEPEPKKIRVAIYARVSTQMEIQQSSIETQITALRDEISRHPDWKYVGTFADVGTSGLRLKGRPQFQKLLKYCDKGKIDLILTKSISRFSRNTIDCLEIIRMLNKLNVKVKFDQENIETQSEKGELLLTILAALSQQESNSIGDNISMGIEYRFQMGKEFINCERFLGYNKDENGKLIIDEKQAVTVKRIFDEYLSGCGFEKIARKLTDEEIPNGAGNTKWYPHNIYQILTNERYIGDALLQKTYTVNRLTGERKKNEGEKGMYYATGCHEAIISKETFEKVKAEMQRRKDPSIRKTYSSHPYSGKIVCGICGDLYRRVVWTNNNKRYIVWRCITRKQKGKEACNSRTVYESEIDEAIKNTNNTNLCDEEFVRNRVMRITVMTTTVEVEAEENLLQSVLDGGLSIINNVSKYGIRNLNILMSKKIAFLFGAGAEKCLGLPSGDDYKKETICLEGLSKTAFGKSLKKYFLDKCFFEKKFKYSLSCVGSLHPKKNNNGFSNIFLDKYFHSIIDPQKSPTAFSVVFNYYWSCYYSIINSLLKNNDSFMKQKDFLKYQKEGEADLSAILDDIEGFTKLLYSLDINEVLAKKSNYYFEIKKELDNSNGKFKCAGVITTNYYRFVEFLNLSEDKPCTSNSDNKKTAYINGKLEWFEYPGLLEVGKPRQKHNKEVFFPFIFGQSNLKPVVSPCQIEEFKKAQEILDDSNCLVVIGYGFCLDDNHLNSFIHNYASRKQVYIVTEKSEEEILVALKLRNTSNLVFVKTGYEKGSIKKIIDKVFSQLGEKQ